MIKVGSVVSGTVTRVEPYGVYLRAGGDTMLVLAPEVTWTTIGDLRERFHIGDVQDVVALGYNQKTGETIGSLRRLHPEQNPYRQLIGLDPRAVLNARVVQCIEDEVTVSLESGAWGHVPRRLLPTGIRNGDQIEVRVTALDADDGRLQLEPASESSQKTNGSANPPPAAIVVS